MPPPIGHPDVQVKSARLVELGRVTRIIIHSSVEQGGIARDATARRLRTYAPNPRNFFEKNHPVFLFHTKESKRRKHVRRRSHERRQDDPIGGVHQGDETIGRGCRG